ncbi:hypothetical protein HDE_09122 [Halotydeus destructor]|nr:hypothetical protein HDE_09122 [Halotydeus destructor]
MKLLLTVSLVSHLCFSHVFAVAANGNDLVTFLKSVGNSAFVMEPHLDHSSPRVLAGQSHGMSGTETALGEIYSGRGSGLSFDSEICPLCSPSFKCRTICAPPCSCNGDCSRYGRDFYCDNGDCLPVYPRLPQTIECYSDQNCNLGLQCWQGCCVPCEVRSRRGQCPRGSEPNQNDCCMPCYLPCQGDGDCPPGYHADDNGCCVPGE